MNRRQFITAAGAGLLGWSAGCAGPFLAGRKRTPNILFIFVDDMGFGDPSCFGNEAVATPNIDRLAEEGTRFTQFYVNSPVCSPSRVAMTTGQYPGRWGVHSYLASREQNKKRNMVDFLDGKAPSAARQLKAAGYATAHFGKWHMGGGRDVDDAPHPEVYGFDESSVMFEGLGDRLLIRNDGLSTQSSKLGQGETRWVEKHEISGIRVDQTVDFIRRTAGKKPFYINLWFNDVHDAHLPAEGTTEPFKAITKNPYEQKFFAVLTEMDRQIGRLMAALKECGQDENTLIVLTSDNGPTDRLEHYNSGWTPPGSTGPFFGRKWSLYEGGIRMPFIVRWPGNVPAGRVNDMTVMCGVDMMPTFCAIGGALPPKDVTLDGEDMSRAFCGEAIIRSKPILWYYPNQPKPGKPEHVSPTLAIREGDWKLLINPDGSDVHLYNVAEDEKERKNLAEQQTDVVTRLSGTVLDWYKTLRFRQ